MDITREDLENITREDLEKELEQGEYSEDQKKLARAMFETDTYKDMTIDKELIGTMDYILSLPPSMQGDINTATIVSNLNNLHQATVGDPNYSSFIEGYYDVDSNYFNFCKRDH